MKIVSFYVMSDKQKKQLKIAKAVVKISVIILAAINAPGATEAFKAGSVVDSAIKAIKFTAGGTGI